MSKHTPGPWMAHKAKDGTWLIDGMTTPAWIARTVPPRNLTTGMAEFDTSADARLIAAAPELLEALAVVLLECEQKLMYPTIRKARAAIAKATGEQP